MGIIKVNFDVKPKIFLILIICSLLGILFWGYQTINAYIKTNNYIKISATVIEKTHTCLPDNCYHYLILNYTHSGIEYTDSQRVDFTFKQVGDKVNIYINPNNPTETRDNYTTTLNIVALLLFLIFHLFTIKAYKIRIKHS